MVRVYEAYFLFNLPLQEATQIDLVCCYSSLFPYTHVRFFFRSDLFLAGWCSPLRTSLYFYFAPLGGFAISEKTTVCFLSL